MVKRSLKNLHQNGYLDELMCATEKARELLSSSVPHSAIILVAGFGMRMVPINTTISKDLLENNGEQLIERSIKQLHEIGITDITIIVGFMKERYEYLIDFYGVELVVNSSYAEKNNIHALSLVASRISNTYIIPCDIRCNHNQFSRYELYSWYMVSDVIDDESDVSINRKMELVRVG